jgi:hypothetical protein
MSGTIQDREKAAARAVKHLSAGNTFADWAAIGAGLAAGREVALTKSGAKSPFGPHYTRELHAWKGLARNAWTQDPRLAHPTSSNATWVHDNLPAIETWRATLSDQERDAFNHPGTIRRQFSKAQGGGRKRGRAGPKPPGNLSRPTKAAYAALRAAFDRLAADQAKLQAEHAALQKQQGGLAGYAKYPLLGLEPPHTERQVTAVYRKLSSVFHPDRRDTGSVEQMVRLNRERDKALREASRPGGTGVSAP